MCKRGDIYWLDFNEYSTGKDHRQTGIRPIVIVQNNIGNKYSPTIIVAAITTQLKKIKQPTHVLVETNPSGLRQESMILSEQIYTVNKEDLKYYTGHLSNKEMIELDNAMGISFGMNNEISKENTIIDMAYIQKLIYKIKRNKEKYDKYKEMSFKMVSDSLLETLNDYFEVNNIDKNKLKLQWRNYNIEYSKKVSC